MGYEYLTQYDSPNYKAGRPYGIDCIAIHWWGDPATNPSFNGVINWLCRQNGSSSAHYVAEAGRVACIVDPDNRAWANGDGIDCNSAGNDRAISIECNPRQSDGDYATIGELVRNLRSVYGDLPLYPHRHFSQTACPGTYDLDRIDRIARGQSAGAAPAPSQPAASVAGAWTVNVAALNVRTQPSLSAPIVAAYSQGQTVVLDGWTTTADGYRWGRYIGASSGQHRYIALGPESGGNYLTR